MDSSVLLDVVAGDVPSAGRAAEALQNARAEGELLVCECVIAEIAPEISPPRRAGCGAAKRISQRLGHPFCSFQC